MMAYQKSLGSTMNTLKDFCYNLAAALINSANNVYFQNVLIAEPNRAHGRRAEAQDINTALGFDRHPNKLAEHLLQEQWPKRHWYRSFMNQKNLLELRFTQNDEFNHELSKDKKSGKLHCTLCVVGKTMYRCNAKSPSAKHQKLSHTMTRLASPSGTATSI
jgi:hypothetical protein